MRGSATNLMLGMLLAGTAGGLTGCGSGPAALDNQPLNLPSASTTTAPVTDTTTVDRVTASHSWHPGHYIFCSQADLEGSNLAEIKRELALTVDGTPVFRGVQVACNWNDLDTGTSSANYAGFKKMDQDLSGLNLSANQYVWIQVQTKSFTGYVPGTHGLIPDWLAEENDPKTNSVFHTTDLTNKVSGKEDKGVQPSIWSSPTHQALIAFYQALGQHLLQAQGYQVEGANLPETALSISGTYPWPGGGIDSKDSNGTPYYQTYVENVSIEGITLRNALTSAGQTLTALQYTNDDYSYGSYDLLDTSASDPGMLQTNGVGQGGPDVTDDTSFPGLLNNVYPTYSYASGHIALGTAVQGSDYASNTALAMLERASTSSTLPNPQPNNANLHLNYMYWLWDSLKWSSGGDALSTFQKYHLNMNNTLLVTARPSGW